MEATAPEENINQAGKASAEITHTERIVDETLKSETKALTRAQIRRFTALCDLRVLPMLGVIYAFSILDRINVSLRSIRPSGMLLKGVADWLSQSARNG
jgi:hypothetical protein